MRRSFGKIIEGLQVQYNSAVQAYLHELDK